MDISKLTDREKSVLLAKAMGWEIQTWPNETEVVIRVPPRRKGINDLYDSENMASAKKAITWGWLNIPAYTRWLDSLSVATWILVSGNGIAFGLDKLVIEAGLVELEEEKG